MKKFKSLFLLLILALIMILLFSSSYLSQNKDIRSRAAASCHAKCATEPSCCAEIIKRLNELGDISDLPDDEQPYHMCDWDANNFDLNDRGFCKPSTCNQLPAGVKYRGRCGWYWGFHEGATNSPNGYGCVIGSGENDLRSLCDGGGRNTTPSPNVTQPPGGGGEGGTLKVVIHENNTSGPIWSSNEDIPSPYTDKDSLLIYINGPTARGSFGELLFVPGADGEQCSSETGFPYSCAKGTIEWKGDDGTSGTSAGNYSVSLAQAPKGWKVKDGSAQGTLSASSTLTLDLSLEQGAGGGPTPTPDPNATATPMPDPNASPTRKPTKGPKPSRTPTPSREPTDRINQGSSIGETIRNIFSSPTPTSGLININLLPSVSTVLNGVNTNANQVLSVVGSLVRTIQNIDQTLENGINERMRSILNQNQQ